MYSRMLGRRLPPKGSASLPPVPAVRSGQYSLRCKASQEERGQAVPDYKHAVDVEEFRSMGYQVVDMICSYMKNIEQYPVKPDVQPGYLRTLLPDAPPKQPERWEDIQQDIQDNIMPGVMHWQSPRFFAYFAANTSFPGILAEMLIGALNMIGFSWQSSPVSTELEMVMMDWLAGMCGLPDKFLSVQPGSTSSSSSTTGNGNSSSSSGGAAGARAGGGVIQGTTSEAVLVAMLAARAKAMEGQPPEAALRLVAYGSDQSHSCFKKACLVLGLEHYRVLPASPEHDWAVQPEALEAAISADLAAGLIPFYAMATVGTTSSCAVDPIDQWGLITQRHNIWLHVDSAWAGSAAICPEHRGWFKGLELADSFSFNPHKWLLTTFDCCAMWVADSRPLKEALALTPAFLRAQGNVYDYKDWQIPLGRRFRSLKLWMVLRMYGVENLQQLVRHHVALGEWFAAAVTADKRFEIATPPRFGLTCFRLAGADKAANEKVLEAVNSSGKAFIISTELGGKYTLRFAIGSAQTQICHVQDAWAAIQAAASQVQAEGLSQAAITAETTKGSGSTVS